MGFCLDINDVETSYRHRKKQNSEHAVAVGKLARVSDDKLTSKGKQALNELTKEATSDYSTNEKEKDYNS